MTASQSLKAALVADSAILALVGNGDSPLTARIYPLLALPPDGRPTITYELTSTCEYTLDTIGPITLQIDMRCWAADYEVAHQLADAVRAVLAPSDSARGFAGALGGVTGINVIQCLWAADGAKETEREIAVAADRSVFEIQSPYELIYNL